MGKYITRAINERVYLGQDIYVSVLRVFESSNAPEKMEIISMLQMMLNNNKGRHFDNNYKENIEVNYQKNNYHYENNNKNQNNNGGKAYYNRDYYYDNKENQSYGKARNEYIPNEMGQSGKKYFNKQNNGEKRYFGNNEYKGQKKVFGGNQTENKEGRGFFDNVMKNRFR